MSKKYVEIRSPKEKEKNKNKINTWITEKSDNQTKRFTISCPIEIHKRIKILSVKSGKTMNEIILECLTDIQTRA
jgi:hypothetical protein